MKYDTVIIGAGLSGLAAGIRLAYFDKSVCILERHTTIGGLNSFYRLRDRNFDVGLHAVTNFAPPGTRTGPLSKLLRQLRLTWDDFALCPQNFSTIEFPGHSIRFDNDFSAFRTAVHTEFPQQADGFDALVEQINGHDELRLDAEESSARTVLESHISDPLLIEMLFCPLMFYGSPTPRDMDFSQFVIMFKSIFREGFARPWEGVRRLLRPLVRKFKSLGGELKLRSGVQSINTSGDRANSVTLDDGSIVEADSVLSSAGVAETFDLLHTREREPTDAPGDISFVEVIFTLDCEPADLGHDATIIFYNTSDKFVYENPCEPVDLRSGIICSPNNFEYDRPLDEGRIRLTALANSGYWHDLPQPDYEAAKKHWCDLMLEQSLKFVPEYRQHIVDTDMFTPRTIRHFTGHLNGCVYGAPHKRRDGHTPIENVFLCGTDQGFLGIVGAMLSGITMANNHLLR